MKKAGGYLKSILPLIVMLAIQFVGSTIQLIRFMLQYGVEAGTDIYTNSTLTVLLIVDVMTLGVAGLWYYISVIKRWEKYGIRVTSLFEKKDLLDIFLLAIGMQFLVILLMTVWGILAPDAMDAYTDLIDESGIGTLGILALLATVIIGPIEEELIFRGLTIEYLKRVGASFWVINIIQALFFGIAHLNLIQGSYAFLMGLVSGYLVLRYRSIWAGIAFHMIFNGYNFLEAILSGALDKLPELLQLLLYLIAGAALVTLSLRRINRELDTKIEAENQAEIPARAEAEEQQPLYYE